MLDTATKKRIDDCRDILVGKLPDPKAQIEQITIALIYKFMDDMDKEAIELGGKAKFFSGDHEKYGWDQLFDARVTATEMLRLYSEAIVSMEKNPNIPQLFRDIFKNAYLPYRDPETLKLFLKTIDGFQYTHSEKLGDAFEYLLSVMGSQGDAGQFRTPRHIIDFVVAIVDPGKNDTILDPACGTAGFLISAFKHILNTRRDAQLGVSTDMHGVSTITPDEQKKIIQNFVGYDISPDMVRLSLVNLYLHGFSDPHIHEYDTLSSEERWNETYDVILANPPFMSPKGGIRPHKKFTISSNRSEVLFVDYIAEHLNPKGRAGVIVPEGVIFQSGTAYKDLRKMLVENYLYAVVSLPAGVFNPYSGVKTSILLMDKEVAKQRNEVLFVRIDNDGYNLGAQRTAVKGSQLEEAMEVIHEFAGMGRDAINRVSTVNRVSTLAHAVPKTEIAKNGDYNLSGERYKIDIYNNSNYPIVKVEEVSKINPLKNEIKDLPSDTVVSFVPMADLNENQISFEVKQTRYLSEVYNGYTYFQDGDVIIAKVTPCFENGKAGVAKKLTNGIGFGSSEFYVLRAENKITPEYLYRVLSIEKFREYAIPKMTGTGGLRRVPKNVVAEFQIPLPPLSIQEEIVVEIESYQKIIDGARQVVENYQPKIDIDPEWEMVELGEISEFKNGLNFSKESTGEKIKILGVSHFKNNLVAPIDELEEIRVDNVIGESYLLKGGDLVFVRSNGNKDLVGRSLVIPEVTDRISFSGFTIRCRLKKDLNPLFYGYLFKSDFHSNLMKTVGRGANIRNLSQEILNGIRVPVPPIDSQHQIVSQIEKEQELVNANKQLIEIFEQKIKDRIAKVWGEEKGEMESENYRGSMAAEPEIKYQNK